MFIHCIFLCHIPYYEYVCEEYCNCFFLPFFCSKLKIRQCCIENYATILDSSCIINLPVIHAVEKSDL